MKTEKHMPIWWKWGKNVTFSSSFWYISIQKIAVTVGVSNGMSNEDALSTRDIWSAGIDGDRDE